MFTVHHGSRVVGKFSNLDHAQEKLVRPLLESEGWTDLEYHPQTDNSFHVWGIPAGSVEFSFTDVVVYWS